MEPVATVGQYVQLSNFSNHFITTSGKALEKLSPRIFLMETREENHAEPPDPSSTTTPPPPSLLPFSDSPKIISRKQILHDLILQLTKIPNTFIL